MLFLLEDRHAPASSAARIFVGDVRAALAAFEPEADELHRRREAVLLLLVADAQTAGRPQTLQRGEKLSRSMRFGVHAPEYRSRGCNRPAVRDTWISPGVSKKVVPPTPTSPGPRRRTRSRH
jgi:hypothetical protein